jgi:hypothetical protein
MDLCKAASNRDPELTPPVEWVGIRTDLKLKREMP